MFEIVITAAVFFILAEVTIILIVVLTKKTGSLSSQETPSVIVHANHYGSTGVAAPQIPPSTAPSLALEGMEEPSDETEEEPEEEKPKKKSKKSKAPDNFGQINKGEEETGGFGQINKNEPEAAGSAEEGSKPSLMNPNIKICKACGAENSIFRNTCFSCNGKI
jgi:hypothetical protein